VARYLFFVTSGGEPKTGLVPAVDGWRNADATSPGDVPIPAELDSVNAPGVYYFDAVPTKDCAVVIDADPAGVGGVPVAERYLFVVVTPDDAALTEARMQRVLALAGQINYRLKEPTHDANGNMTVATLVGYENGADATADENPIITLSLAAVYDDDGNLDSYVTREV